MLIDSGAEISAISDAFQIKIADGKTQIPTLPLSGLNIYNAIGNTMSKAKCQMSLPITIDTFTTHAPFIVIPKLNEDDIIVNNFLEKNCAVLDFEN